MREDWEILELRLLKKIQKLKKHARIKRLQCHLKEIKIFKI